MKTSSLSLRNRRVALDGVLVTFACLVAIGGFLGHEISWLFTAA